MNEVLQLSVAFERRTRIHRGRVESGTHQSQNVEFRQITDTNVPQNANSNTKPPYCGYCRTSKHSWNTCPIIAKKKADGTWKDRSRAGPSRR
jgi:hypothetical protein